MNRDQIATYLRGLAEVKPSSLGKLTPERMEIYYQGLADVPDAALAHAFERALRELTFFPGIEELRNFAGANQTDSARIEDAWAMLNHALPKTRGLHSLRLPGALAEAVRRMGGLETVVWRMDRAENNDWQTFGRRDFLAIYKEVMNRDWPEHLPGYAEKLNSHNPIKYAFKTIEVGVQPALPAKEG